MRILYCNKYNFGFSGTESYLLEAMDLMRARGHEVALFSMEDPRGRPTAYDRYFVRHVDFKSADRLTDRARLAARAIYSVEARRNIRALIEEFRPEVAHVRNIYHHLSPSILWELKAQGIPILYHMNDFKLLCPSYNMVDANGEACEGCKGGKFRSVIFGGCYPAGAAAAAVLALEAYVHRWLSTYEKCIDLILAPSRFVKRKLVEHGWADSRIEVLPHFQNLPDCAPPHPGNRAPILYFGRLSREKGLRDLISAMAKVPHINLVIAGDGPQRQELEELSGSLHLQNVTFVGHVAGEKLEKLVAAAQFTIFPSLAYETMGKSILESYALGRAVIATDLGSRRELIDEGKTGILYRVKDVDQLAGAIAFLSERPDLARQMGEAGRELVRQRHSQEQHFETLGNIYEQLAARGQARRVSRLTASPLRVAFIGGRGVVGKYSGIESYYEQVGSRLAARGNEITVYCRTYFTPEIAEHNGVRIVRLPTIRSKHLDTLVHTFLSTVHACFSNYDIVHYHTLGPSLFAFLPRIVGKKTIVTVQGLDWQRKKWSWLARQTLRCGEWTSANFPNRTVVVSRTLESYYQSQYGKPTLYLPNGTETHERTHGEQLGRMAIDPDQYVLFLGRFSPEKNCDLLIKAFEHTDTAMKLVFAGGSSHTDEYVASLRPHESDQIKFVNWLSGEALAEVLTNAALFVLPSDLEGLSLALLDAMGAGICVLASDAPENQEVIGTAGFTFKRGDVDDLQRMLSLLLPDPRTRSATGEKALARVRENYLWDSIAEGMEEIYVDLKRPAAKEGSVVIESSEVA